MIFVISSKRKIGILTFHKSQSYGAVLQCYALYNALKNNLRCDVGIIDFYPPRFAKNKKKTNSSPFYDFSNRNLPFVTEECSTLDQCLVSLKNDQNPITDIVVGSDQVWNPEILKDTLQDYFLCQAMPGIKKYAYAASFGTETLQANPQTAEIISNALKDFHAIGVREKNGVQICMELGRDNAHEVVDPTLLVPSEIYDRFIDQTFCPNRICGFFLAKQSYQPVIVKAIARSQKVSPLFLAGKAPFFSFIKSVKTPGVEQFVSAIHNSAGVVTDSFHGVCFAIIFKRQFVVLPSYKKDRFIRIAALLEKFGLQDRVIADYNPQKAVSKMLEPIDYSKVYDILLEHRKTSMDFIKTSFEQ